jgi:hypothetical protein
LESFGLTQEVKLGLRGAHAVKATRRPSTDELVITDDALRIYRRMRRLDRQCTCPSCSVADVCPACERWWILNGRLNAVLGVGGPWIPSYEAPDDECERAYVPKQSGRDRFFKLEAAASRAKKRRYEYKWQK